MTSNTLTPPVLEFTGWAGPERVKPAPPARYGNGRLAVQMLDADTGEGAGVVTVNLPEQPLGDDEHHIKAWGENEPTVKALVEAGWLEPTGREDASGYVMVPVMRLAGDLLAYLDEWAAQA